MKILTGLSFLVIGFAGFAQGSQLILNGGFETGSLANWTNTSQAGSSGNFFVSTSKTTPVSSSSTAGPASGADYAVSDALGPGTHILSQTFTVPAATFSVVLSYSLFVNSYGGNLINAAGLDYTAVSNQYARVDIIKSSASLFDTGAGVIGSFYAGTDLATTNPNAYKSYSFDITSLVGSGGAFTLRFAEVNNVDVLNMGIDNVSILTASSGVPEPSCLAFAVLGLSVVAGRAFRMARARPVTLD